MKNRNNLNKNLTFFFEIQQTEISWQIKKFLSLPLQQSDHSSHLISMQNDHAQPNINIGRSMSSDQNEDANAIAIDCMLVNLKNLLKKTLLMKKLMKQFSQRKQPFQQNQTSQKITYINQQTSNLPLTFDKTIPPDKRMTNLFYMRMFKQIVCYQKIIPSFAEIRPKLQQCYSLQVSSDQFSILDLYLLCEKKFIMQIKQVKNKLVQMLKDQQSGRLMIVRQDSLEQVLIERRGEMGRVGDYNSGGVEESKGGGSRFSTISGITHNLFLKQPMPQPASKKPQPPKCYKTLSQAIQNASKSQLYLDFKQRTTQLLLNPYSPLDIQSIEIISYFIPTLMPQDNIDFIYQKVKPQSKRTRKQIREFQTGYALFVLRKEENNRRKLRKQDSRKRVESLVIKEQRAPLKIVSRGSAEFEIERGKVVGERKSQLPTVEILKPIVVFKDSTIQQRDRTVSRFRQRFEQSLQHPKQSSALPSKFNTLNPLPVNDQKPTLSTAAKQKNKKLLLDQSTTSLKQNRSSIQQFKPLKKGNSMNKTEKTQVKVSRFSEKRGRSLKNRSNKEIVSRKLKL